MWPAVPRVSGGSGSPGAGETGIGSGAPGVAPAVTPPAPPPAPPASLPWSLPPALARSLPPALLPALPPALPPGLPASLALLLARRRSQRPPHPHLVEVMEQIGRILVDAERASVDQLLAAVAAR